MRIFLAITFYIYVLWLNESIRRKCTEKHLNTLNIFMHNLEKLLFLETSTFVNCVLKRFKFICLRIKLVVLKTFLSDFLLKKELRYAHIQIQYILYYCYSFK